MSESFSEKDKQFPATSDQLGRLLVDSGKLRPTDVDRILMVQKREGMRFGEAALALKIVSQDDLLHALSSQYEYTYLYPGEGGLSPELIVAYQPFSKATEAIRAIRSQLMMRWFNDKAHKSLAVVSSERGDGRSYFAANLAVVFSQLGRRTLLIDADFRSPRQHRIFNLANNSGLSTLLAGHRENVQSTQVQYFPNLSILVSGPIPPNPLELLSRREFKQFLLDAAERFDFVLIDTPSGGQYSDAQVIASQSSAAVAISRKHHTRLQPAYNFISLLRNSGVEIVGVVANLSIGRPLWDARLKTYLTNTFLGKISRSMVRIMVGKA